MSSTVRSSRRPRARRRWALAAAAVLAMVATSASPGGALTRSTVFPGQPGQHDDMVTVRFNVNAAFTPLTLLCGSQLDFLWYAPGTSPDYMWLDVGVNGPTIQYTNATIRINGVYQPLVGDFDGNGCDDVFWYAPGLPTDSIWFNQGGGSFSTLTGPFVNGVYRPVVNRFEAAPDYTDDILWYAPGAAAESIFVGALGVEDMFRRTAPRVNGDYVPLPARRFSNCSGCDIASGVLWYGVGRNADAYTQVRAGSTTPQFSSAVPNLNNPYIGVPFYFWPLMYQPGIGEDVLWWGLGTNQRTLGQIFGSYVIGSSATAPIAVLHAPGPATDQLLFETSEPFAASDSTTVSDWSYLGAERRTPAGLAESPSAQSVAPPTDGIGGTRGSAMAALG